MPKLLFYPGTVFCLFLALMSAGAVGRHLGGSAMSFAAIPVSTAPVLAILTALVAGIAVALLFLRMASLLAARNLFAALVAVLAISGGTAALVAVLFLQWRMHGGAPQLAEVHFAAFMVFAFFLSLTLLSLRPYFSIQASRFLSALVFFPLPLFGVILSQEMLVKGSPAPLPLPTPASGVFYSVAAVLFFSIGVHCIRHRHLFLEMTNLRELLDSRIDPASRDGRPIGGVAFDS